MNDPKQPKDPPPEQQGRHKPAGPGGGTPPGISDAEPKGSPSSDRQQTETAADPAKH